MDEIMDISEISDSREIYEKKEPIFFRVVLIFFSILFIAIFIFAYFFEIEEYVYVESEVTRSEPISDVYVKKSGEIIELNVKNDDVVNKGDVLFKIDSSDISLQINYEKQKEVDCLDNIVMYNKLYDSITAGKNLLGNTDDEKMCYLQYQNYENNINKMIDELNVNKDNISLYVDKLYNSKEITIQNKKGLKKKKKEYELFLQYIKQELNNFSSEDVLVDSMTNNFNYEIGCKSNELENKNKELQKHKEQLEIYYEKMEEYKKNRNNHSKEKLNEINEKIEIKKKEVKADKEEIKEIKKAINTFRKDYEVKIAENIDNLTLQIDAMDDDILDMEFAINNPELCIEDEIIKLYYKTQMLYDVNQQIEKFQDEYLEHEYNISLFEHQMKSNTYLASCSGVVNMEKGYNESDYIVQNQLIMQIVPKCELEIKLYINESDRAKINIKDTIYYDFDALPEKEYGKVKGSILSLSDVVSNNQNGYFYIGNASIEKFNYVNQDGEKRYLYDGMLAPAKITINEKKLIIWLWEKVFE